MKFLRSCFPYIPTDEGWLYLAGLKDLFNGELVGYAMSERMTKTWSCRRCFGVFLPSAQPRGCHHSDRGSQYCAHDYQKLLQQFDMTPK
ncbi:MAG: DDE-type integrase/transposase/recombinase [Pseudomonadota bacterium]